MTGARHGMCELMARHGHGMLCVNRLQQTALQGSSGGSQAGEEQR